MAVRINASGEYLRRTANLPAGNSFTICGWAKSTQALGTYQYFACLESASASADEYIVLGWDSATNGFGVSTGDISSTFFDACFFASKPTDETWFFFALTCNGFTTNSAVGYWAYHDDTAFKTCSADAYTFTPGSLTLGNDSYDEFCNIALAAIKVYDVALTENQLWREMRRISPTSFTSLNVYSPLFDTSDVVDYSGNGRNWTSAGSLSSEANPPVSYGTKIDVLPYAVAAPGTSIPVIYHHLQEQRIG